MEDQRDKKGPFYDAVWGSLPALADHLPDGISKTKWQRLGGKFRMAWNIVAYQGLYEAEPVFTGLFNRELKLGDILTPCAVTTFIPDLKQTVVFQNRETEHIVPSRMPHDLFVARPDLPAWVVSSWSSAIPFVFCRHRPVVAAVEMGDKDTGFAACNVATTHGFIPVDGAVSAAYGAVGASSHKNKVIVTVHKTPKAKKLTYAEGWRPSNWWFIGAFWALAKSAMYLLENESDDKLKLAEQLGAKELNCSPGAARKVLGKKNKRKYPDHKGFNAYDMKTTKEIFEYQYTTGRKEIQEHFENEIKSYAEDGVVIAVSSGGAYAIDELAKITALCDILLEQPTVNKKGIINLITGTSAGSLNALYISQVHDIIFNLQGDDMGE